MKIKDTEVNISPAGLMIINNGETLLVPSMVASTVLVCALITVAPWLAPVMMADVQNSAA